MRIRTIMGTRMTSTPVLSAVPVMRILMILMLMVRTNCGQMVRRRVRTAPEREDISYW